MTPPSRPDSPGSARSLMRRPRSAAGGAGAPVMRSGLAPAGTCLSELDQLLHDVVYGPPAGCGAARRVEAGEFRGAHPGERGDHAEQLLRLEPVADHLVALG